MKAEGINFETNVKVGEEVSAKDLLSKSDVLLLCMGSAWARDLPIPGLYTIQYMFILTHGMCNTFIYHVGEHIIVGHVLISNHEVLDKVTVSCVVLS